jgi:hypothetical protein
MKKQPAPGNMEKDEEATLLRNMWNSGDEKLLKELKNNILSGAVLQRPNSNRRFYLKSD